MRTLELSSETIALSTRATSPVRGTIGAEIRRHGELQPDHAAIVATGFEPFSYGELQRLIDDVRAGLRRAGFGRNARIAIAMRSGPQAALAIVSVACSAVSIPLNPRQTLSEIEACLAALRPDAVFVAEGADSAARRTAERKGITIVEATLPQDGTLSFSIAAPKISIPLAPNESDEPEADAPAFILQTSGTSAEPKLIPTSHRNMLAAAGRVQTWFNLTAQDRCLSVTPVFYAHGLHVTVFAPLLSGGTIAFTSDASKFHHSEWFGALKPTWYSAGPTVHRLVFDHIKSNANTKPDHSLRFILSGGAPLPRDVLEGLHQILGVPVVEHYGSSEGMQICSNLLPPGRSKPGTVGVPLPDTIQIVGDDDGRLPAGVRGEIWVGGPTVVSGYLDGPELNRASFIDGWFKSGDIGSLDADGFLTLHGRKDDLINRGGEKISPAEIDEALMRHPAVAEAAAFPVPHRRLGEDVAAAVVLRPGMTVRPIELRDYLREQLAPFKVPRRIVVQDQLPKGQTGKVVRRRLAESLEEMVAAEAQTAAPQSIKDTCVDSDLIPKLTKIWERLLKTEPLYPDDDFYEKGGDSLLAMELLVELEILTGRSIPNSILLDAPTIRLLAQKLSELKHIKRQFLIQLNSSGSQAPLFHFHGDYNCHGYSAIVMARLLGSEQPLFVVYPHGTDNEPIPSSIEAMAADRLPLILKAQPEGPYRLFGNCIGGIVAFEVARLLVAAGKEVELVVMLDPPTINARRSVQFLFSIMRAARAFAGPAVERPMAWMWVRCMDAQRFWNVSRNRRWTAIKQRVNGVVARSKKEHAAPIVADEYGEPSPRDLMFERIRKSSVERDMKYAYVLSNYFPTPLSVRTIYFSVDYGAGAWRRIARDLEIIKSPGHHSQFNFADIASHLRPRLQAGK